MQHLRLNALPNILVKNVHSYVVKKSKYNRHILTAKHKNATKCNKMQHTSEMIDPLSFECNTCKYVTNRQGDYERHMQTKTHLKKVECNTSAQTRTQMRKQYQCECGKTYSHRSSFWVHMQRCKAHNDAKKAHEIKAEEESFENPENVNTPHPPENKVVQEGMNETIMIKCFQTMMEAQAEQTRLLIEAIGLNECGTKFPLKKVISQST